jgi:hypothetical protein
MKESRTGPSRSEPATEGLIRPVHPCNNEHRRPGLPRPWMIGSPSDWRTKVLLCRDLNNHERPSRG